MEYSDMADVKIHRCFPTTIAQFVHYPDNMELKNMKAHIKWSKKNHRYHTEDDLHTISYYADLRDIILQNTKMYMADLKYEYEKLEITGMWANHLFPGDAHPPHTHSNNFLSGVYYLKGENGAAPIQFFDPRPQANILRPRNEPTWENATMVQFDAVTGMGYIFPSWLQHWVPPTEEDRISISWNILVRGYYGEKGTLQNAYI